MARPRGRPSTSTPAKAMPAKRQASPLTTPRRQSKRIKSVSEEVNATPKKSIYFEPESTPETQDSKTDGEEASGYEDEDASVTEADDLADEDAISEDDENPYTRKSRGGGEKTSSRKGSAAKSKASVNGKELWRQGVRSNLAPGEEVFIELPKARPAGKTPYADDRIHPNTLLFLGDLKQNNERVWLKTHDADFRQAEKDWKSFVEVMSEKLTEVDETIPELPVKDVVYRIYRDIRFSPDPTPYKPYFSAAWSRTGRKGPYAVYYAHIQPKGQSMIGGGLWMPDAGQLRKLRRHIDRKPDKLKEVLLKDGIRKSFLNGAAKDKQKVVKAFAASNKGNALKHKPKDYEVTHPEIELLKLRNFTIGAKLNDEEITGPNVLQRMIALLADLEPFITYLNSVVMPDEESDDDQSEEEGDEEGDEQQDNDEDGSDP